MESLNRLRILVAGEIAPVVIELRSQKKEALEFLSRVARENNCFSLIDSVPGYSSGNVQMKIRVVVSIADLADANPRFILDGVDSGKILTVDVICPEGPMDDEERFAAEMRTFLNLAAVQ